MEPIRKVDIIIDAVILVLVTYYVADTLSNGEFSREISIRVIKLHGNLKTRLEHRRIVSKDVGKVIWDAITTIEDRGEDQQAG